MFDIEKGLQEINTGRDMPGEALRQETRRMMRHAAEGRTKAAKKSFVWSYRAATGILLAILLLFAVFPRTGYCAAYYTIDINPSISVEVDRDDRVIAVHPENEDAAELLMSLNIVGMQFKEAFKAIVQAAVANNYLEQNGHVLVAHFGNTGGISEQEIQRIVREEANDTVSVLMLNGNKADFEKAKHEGAQAGIDLLKNNGKAKGLSSQDVDQLIRLFEENTKKSGQEKNNGNGDNADENKKSNNGKKTEPEESHGNTGTPQNQNTNEPDGTEENDSNGNNGENTDNGKKS
ncbi:MAG: anti-sigma-I factor RsgI family protein [Christensenellales bacterium]